MFREEETVTDRALRRERGTEHGREWKRDTYSWRKDPSKGMGTVGLSQKVQAYCASQAVPVQSPGPTLRGREPTPELPSDLQHPWNVYPHYAHTYYC